VLAAAGTKPSKPTPTTAKAAVEAGLQVFQESKDYAEAVRLFKAALDLKPSSEEAAAALFNLGCAYAKQRNFKAASEAIGTAINEHNLKLRVALQVSHIAAHSQAMAGQVWLVGGGVGGGTRLQAKTSCHVH
jgi:tetratricopeptide (TPR) repeat protein